MKILAVLLLSSLLLVANARSVGHPEGRIIGGSDAERRQFPYMVSIQRNGVRHCGATIASKSWIVSAAHCFAQVDPADIVAVAGLLHFGEDHPDVQIVPIAEIVTHPEYIVILGEFVDNDIAMLRLQSPLTFNEAVQPATLPPPQKQPSGKAWLTGFGMSNTSPPMEPNTLQCLEMPVITRAECEELFTKVPQPYELLDTMVCVAPPNDSETACYGDSGSPLAQNGTLVGVVSWGTVLCEPNSPTVFTKVSDFTEFINEHIKSDL